MERDHWDRTVTTEPRVMKPLEWLERDCRSGAVATGSVGMDRWNEAAGKGFLKKKVKVVP